ncbi:MAG: hypothetical protein RSD36_14455 [Terrisporobacter sp.]
MIGEIFNLKKKDYMRIISILLLVILIVSICFVKYFSNIKESGEISRARQALYKITDTDRGHTKFEYSSKNNYVKDKDINKEYYVFKVKKTDGKEYDFNYVVDKNYFQVFVCDNNGFIIPYEDYISKDSSIGDYFEKLKEMKYNDIPAATRNYLDKNGGIKFLNKVSEIIENQNPQAVDGWGGIVKYVDHVLNGVNQDQLNEEFKE